MAEEKILIPEYKRSDNCARCGAGIYSPALEQTGGWPLMSACTCEQGPKMAGRKRKALRQGGEAVPEEQAQAA